MTKRWIVAMTAVAAAGLFAVACDDADGDDGGGGGGSSAGGAGGSAAGGAGGGAAGGAGGSAAGGSGGAGGSAAGGAGGSAAGGAGGSAAGGAGGGGFVFQSFAGCTYETAVAAETVAHQGFTFSPPCVKVAKGGSVTLPGAGSHPLDGMVQNGDQPNPIAAAASGSTSAVTVTFPTEGSYGFYCAFHGSDAADGAGMAGVVYVEP